MFKTDHGHEADHEGGVLDISVDENAMLILYHMLDKLVRNLQECELLILHQ